MKKNYTIDSVKNGYTISLYPYPVNGEATQWVARSWKEVLEILEEIGAPDFKQDK